MRRLRVLFVVFAIALLAPVALLVQRSLQSVALEVKVRQQTIAERIFDEMERALSQLLQREETVPISAYDLSQQVDPDGLTIGRFEVVAEGSSAPARESRIQARPSADFKDNAVADLEEVARSYFRQERKLEAEEDRGLLKRNADKKELDSAQAPGTTVQLGASRRTNRARARDVLSEMSEGVPSDYAALRALNKAASERLAAQFEDGDVQARLDTGGRAPASVQRRAEVLDLSDEAFVAARMTGRAVDSQRMMLFRNVVRDGLLKRQGVLLSIPELAKLLHEKSIGTSWLSSFASVQLFTAATKHPAAVSEGATLYSHRFAVPFSDLTAHLTLKPLSAMRSTAYVYALSIVVLAATVIGLTLLYRMVALTVRFAERRSNFVAAVSHELKTPLTAIRMYGEMLRDGLVANDSKRNEYYHHITNESERLSRLINNVLEYSKLEKGTRPVNLTSATVGPTLNEVAEMMRPHAAERGYVLEVYTGTDLPAVRFEPDALKQVLWNLVDNAIKYGGGGGDKRIAMNAEKEGAGVVVSVRDHGEGVESQHMKEIFEPFYRGENELTRTAKGTGLGLALVRGLVERMGATLEAYNAPDNGFVVRIHFR